MSRRPTRRERMQVIFAFLVFFGGMMFVVSPDPNRAQTVFRIATALAGVIGLVWVSRSA